MLKRLISALQRLLGPYIGKVPGSLRSPHILSHDVFRFSRRDPSIWDIESECLTAVQAWRQNHLEGRFEWVLIYLQPGQWQKVSSMLTVRQVGTLLIADKTRILYQLKASQQEELVAWSEDIRGGN